MTKIAIITGLKSEAALVARALKREPDAPAVVVCAGIGPERANDAARRVLITGATALASFGLAGGLKPDLWPGVIVVAHRVVNANGTAFDADRPWHSRLLRRLMGEDMAIDGILYGSDSPIRAPAAKAALYRATGAVAVDMESHAVAAVAAEAGIPFAAVRAIADPAQRALPDAALSALTAEGRTAPWPALRCLTRAPWTAPALIGLALESGKGRAALRRVIALTGAVLAGVPLREKR